METRTIPEDLWNEYLNTFSRKHADKLVTVELLGAGSWPRLVADHLPLQGVSLDTKGTRPSAVHVTAGEPEASMSHVIDLPLYIRESDDAEGGINLSIEPAEGGSRSSTSDP